MWVRDIPDSSDGTPWLFNRGYKREIEPNDFLAYRHEELATPEDKAVFFSLLEATFFPVEFFSPPPDGMLVPIDEIYLESGEFGSEWWAEGLYCTMDVSCLLSEGYPIGRYFDLPFDDGGIAHVTVTDMEFDLKPLLCVEPDLDRIFWKTKGWVEGYTCEFVREIEFVSDSLKVRMGFTMAQVPGDVELADRSAYLTPHFGRLSGAGRPNTRGNGMQRQIELWNTFCTAMIHRRRRSFMKLQE